MIIIMCVCDDDTFVNIFFSLSLVSWLFGDDDGDELSILAYNKYSSLHHIHLRIQKNVFNFNVQL